MRLPTARATALLATTALAVTLAGCGVPDTPDGVLDVTAPATTEPQETIQPGTPAPVIPDPVTDDETTPQAGDEQPTDQATPTELDDALLEEGRFSLATTRPTAPTPGIGAWDQPLIGARGQAGATCEAGAPVAWTTVSAEHFRLPRDAWFDEPVADHLTGGTVTLTATTPRGEEPLVEHLLPSPEHKQIKYIFDLERLIDPVLDRTGLYWDVDYLDVRPGDLVGALVDRDPDAPDQVTELEAWRLYESPGYYRTFEVAAPTLPVPSDAEVLTFTYALDGYEPAMLDVPVPDC